MNDLNKREKVMSHKADVSSVNGRYDHDKRVTVLSPEGWNKLQAILENPPAATPELKALMSQRKLKKSNKVI